MSASTKKEYLAHGLVTSGLRRRAARCRKRGPSGNARAMAEELEAMARSRTCPRPKCARSQSAIGSIRSGRSPIAPQIAPRGGASSAAADNARDAWVPLGITALGLVDALRHGRRSSENEQGFSETQEG
jgi:hypothetical protein